MFVNNVLISSFPIFLIVFLVIGLSASKYFKTLSNFAHSRRKRRLSSADIYKLEENRSFSADSHRTTADEQFTPFQTVVTTIGLFNDDDLIEPDFPASSLLNENIQLRLDNDADYSENDDIEEDQTKF